MGTINRLTCKSFRETDNSGSLVRPTYEGYYRTTTHPGSRIGIPAEVYHEKYARMELGRNRFYGPNEIQKMTNCKTILSDLQKKGFTIENAQDVESYIFQYSELLPVLEKFACEIIDRFKSADKKVLKLSQSRESSDDKCLTVRIYTPKWKREFLTFINSLYSLPESEILSESDGWLQVGFEHGL